MKRDQYNCKLQIIASKTFFASYVVRPLPFLYGNPYSNETQKYIGNTNTTNTTTPIRTLLSKAIKMAEMSLHQDKSIFDSNIAKNNPNDSIGKGCCLRRPNEYSGGGEDDDDEDTVIVSNYRNQITLKKVR